MITGRKSKKQGMIKGQSKEERVKKWYNHFHDLVGREAMVKGNFQNTGIPKVLDGLLKKNENFSPEEFKEAK